MDSLKKYLYISLGTLSLGIGITGIFLPVLPTTPLLMLSAYCYSKSSEKFHLWLTQTSFYKSHAKDFIENQQLTMRKKTGLLVLASTMLAFPLFILDGVLKLVIIFIYLYLYYYFIFKIKTIKNIL